MIGLNASLSSQRPSSNANRYKWAATHCLQLDQEGGTSTNNYVKVNDLSAILNKVSAAGSADIGDNITISFWLSPLWNIGTVDGVANSVVEGYHKSQIALFSMGARDSATHRITIYYTVRVGSSKRNRISVLTSGTNGYNADQQSLHDDNTIVGCGSSDSNFWEVDNKGNVNSEAFTHLAFTRASGTADWKCYWNGADIAFNVDGDTDTNPDPDETEFDELVLGVHASYLNDNRASITNWHLCKFPSVF